MICSSLNRFFTSNLPPGLDSKPFRYSKAGGRRLPFHQFIPMLMIDFRIKQTGYQHQVHTKSNHLPLVGDPCA